tara:strand:- start:29 stop:1063 length:1035 start_codon:yes stop_codon:yes gene_type:complete
MSKPKFEIIEPFSSRPNDAIVRRKSGDLFGRAIEGFEHLDRYEAPYLDEVTGLSLPFKLSSGVSPKGAGIKFSKMQYNRAGVVVGIGISLGLPHEDSPQQSMRRVGSMIEYGGGGWTHEMIQAADRILGTPHNKVAPKKVELPKPFLKWLSAILGPAYEHQRGQTEETSTERDFLQENTKKILRKMGHKYKWETTTKKEIENPDQNTSEVPIPRAPKTKGNGSNSRGKKTVIVKDYNGKFNVDNQHLGENYPPFDYEMNGEQVVIILNEDCPQTSAILDHHAQRGELGEACPIFEKTMMKAGQQAVSRENGTITPKQWESYVKTYGSLCGVDSDMDVTELREAI